MYSTITEHIRKHLLEIAGVFEKKEKLPDLDTLRQTEWCWEFEEARKNRMLMGAFRYGLFSDPKKWRYNLMAGLRKKLAEYEKTGNTEALVDAANYLMLEYMRPSHPKAHFHALDDHSHCPCS